MNELQIFENPEFGSIRTVEIGGEPWLVGKDVAKALGYNNPQKALRDHVDAEDKTVNAAFTVNGTQGTLINESGVYSLVFSSKLPDAKKFKRWVTSEVLPSIRKTGGYSLPGTPAKTIEDLTAAVQLLTERLDAMTAREAPVPAPLAALPEGGTTGVPGPAARKRWMRIVSEKLDLLSARKGRPNSNLLHQTYQIIEKEWGVSLEEERLRVMEEMELTDCSVLLAIFYTDELKDHFEQIIDFNLAPENRGW